MNASHEHNAGTPEHDDAPVDDVRMYVLNFRWVVALLIGLTALNVVLGLLHVHVAAVALVAALQVSLVFILLMHAMADMRVLTPLLSLCGFFVVCLLALMLVAHTDTIDGTEYIAPAPAESADEAAE